VGIHPTEITRGGLTADEQLTRLKLLIEDEQVRKENKIVAIGEIGLDYYWEPYDKELQQYCFEEQLKLAKKVGLPVIIHDREAHGDCFETILKYPEVIGVFHSYSGSAEMARELVKRGWYISFSGTVSFKNANKVKEAAKVVPNDKILIETDAPYLAPHPYRGKINHSGRLLYTASALSEARGETLEEIAERTRENAKRLFKIF
jgi:TatD DNase family protein